MAGLLHLSRWSGQMMAGPAFILTAGLACLVLLNILALAMMGIDKSRAAKHQWRIPERYFCVLAFLGAAPGILAGMFLFRHKTRHNLFRIGIPLLLLFQLVLAGWLIFR